MARRAGREVNRKVPWPLDHEARFGLLAWVNYLNEGIKLCVPHGMTTLEGYVDASMEYGFGGYWINTKKWFSTAHVRLTGNKHNNEAELYCGGRSVSRKQNPDCKSHIFLRNQFTDTELLQHVNNLNPD